MTFGSVALLARTAMELAMRFQSPAKPANRPLDKLQNT